jgi:hypothetical protein
MTNGWIGVDLDGTLAYYDQWRGALHIGEPIPVMLERVKRWLDEGKDVRIFTARVNREGIASATTNLDGAATRDATAVEECIRQWCEKHVGRALPITCCKDYGMIEPHELFHGGNGAPHSAQPCHRALWDDRCIQVIPNTGRTIADEIESERMALSGKSASP